MAIISTQGQTTSLTEWFAEQIGCSPVKYKQSLTKALGDIDQESLLSALSIAKELGLNPIGGDIYVLNGRTIISFQGWTKLITSRPDFDGLETSFSEKEVNIEGLNQKVPEFVEVKIWRKGVNHPTVIREYMIEAYQSRSQPWRKYPRRMLRHKGVIQCARLTFALRAVGEDFDDDGVISVIETPEAQSQPQTAAQSVTQTTVSATKWRQYKTTESLNTAVQKFVTAMMANGIPESQAIETIRKTVHPAQADEFIRLFREAVSPSSPSSQEIPPEPPEFEQDIPVQVQQIPAQQAPITAQPPQGVEPRVLQAETPDPSEYF